MAMLPYLCKRFGDPSSTRTQVAALLGCQPADIVFTSRGHRGQQLPNQRRDAGRP